MNWLGDDGLAGRGVGRDEDRLRVLQAEDGPVLERIQHERVLLCRRRRRWPQLHVVGTGRHGHLVDALFQRVQTVDGDARPQFQQLVVQDRHLVLLGGGGGGERAGGGGGFLGACRLLRCLVFAGAGVGVVHGPFRTAIFPGRSRR